MSLYNIVLAYTKHYCVTYVLYIYTYNKHCWKYVCSLRCSQDYLWNLTILYVIRDAHKERLEFSSVAIPYDHYPLLFDVLRTLLD